MRTSKKIISLAILIIVTGCGQLQLTGNDSFNISTGLSLPQGTECLATKTITVAMLDTYYLKLHATNDVTAFFTAHFHKANWDDVKEDMTPPSDWMKSLPFWNQSEVEHQIYYSGDYTDKSGAKFKTALSFNTNNMTIYFAGMQCGG